MNYKKHWDKVAQLKCCVCQGPATIHHCKGGSMIDWFGSKISPRGTRCNHFLVIPLCMNHHTGDDGIDVMPTREWEKRFGSQVYHLCQTVIAISDRGIPPYNIWELSGIPEIYSCDCLETYRERNYANL